MPLSLFSSRMTVPVRSGRPSWRTGDGGDASRGPCPRGKCLFCGTYCANVALVTTA